MTHPESKSLSPKGQPCERRTIGLLTRRRIRATSYSDIGKEANRLDERTTGLLLLAELEEALTSYGNIADATN